MSRTGASLRFRLLAGTLAWILATIAGAGWWLQGMFEEHLARQFRGELAIHLNQLAANLELTPAGQAMLAHPLSDPRFERPYSGLYWQVDRMPEGETRGRRGELRARSLWDAELSVPGDRLLDGERHEHRVTGPKGEQLRMIEQMLQPAERPDTTLRLIVAADEALLAEPVERFRGLLLAALALLAGGLAVAAVIQVHAGLRPLKRLRDELTRLRDGGQNALGDDHPGEVQPLVDELNSLLRRNAEFVERARSQAGNLAHAVKTPLAVMANAAADAPGELAELVRAQVGAARAQIDHHLARARVAAAAQGKGLRCAVGPVIDGLIRAMTRLHADRNLDFSSQTDSTAFFRGEAQDLQEMLGNLLDNAGKWAKQRIAISCRRDGELLCIDVDDDGPGIPADQRELLLQRGRRGDEKVPGSGLGLSIVDELAGLYGGQLQLLDSPLGGLRARLCLAAARPMAEKTVD